MQPKVFWNQSGARVPGTYLGRTRRRTLRYLHRRGRLTGGQRWGSDEYRVPLGSVRYRDRTEHGYGVLVPTAAGSTLSL
ncbi:hypothetical protein VTN02DRAFT_6564 [Thermoascus thermophilus]